MSTTVDIGARPHTVRRVDRVAQWIALTTANGGKAKGRSLVGIIETTGHVAAADAALATSPRATTTTVLHRVHAQVVQCSVSEIGGDAAVVHLWLRQPPSQMWLVLVAKGVSGNGLVVGVRFHVCYLNV